MYGSIFNLPPHALERKIHLNSFSLCQRRESNPGCLCSKQVRYPLLHCFLASECLVPLQDRIYRYHVGRGGSLRLYKQKVKWLLAQNQTQKSWQMELKFRKLLRESINNGSTVHIFFKELGYVKYSTDQLFGVVDLIGEPEPLDALTSG